MQNSYKEKGSPRNLLNAQSNQNIGNINSLSQTIDQSKESQENFDEEGQIKAGESTL